MIDLGELYAPKGVKPIRSQLYQTGGSLIEVTSPAVEVVDVDYVKDIGSITISDDDAMLSNYITSATQYLENWLGRAFITQTWKWTRGIRDFLERNEIPRPPLQKVSSLTYMNTLGVETTIDPNLYTVDTLNQPGVIWLKTTYVWPITLMNAAYYAYYIVNFDCGYGDSADDVPQQIKDAVANTVVFWYENRGTLPIPGSITDVLTQYRIFDFKI
ncbi:MAG: phage head-tail connector protein [Candidatus Methanoperedens sp.]